MKSNLPKHFKLLLKCFIAIAGLLITTFTLLLLYQVRERGRLVSPPATPIFTDRYGVIFSRGNRRRERTIRLLGPATGFARANRFVPIDD